MLVDGPDLPGLTRIEVVEASSLSALAKELRGISDSISGDGRLPSMQRLYSDDLDALALRLDSLGAVSDEP